jgi:hypothetical protein
MDEQGLELANPGPAAVPHSTSLRKVHLRESEEIRGIFTAGAGGLLISLQGAQPGKKFCFPELSIAIRVRGVSDGKDLLF